MIPSPLVANVLPIINSAMALKNLPIAANGLPLVPIDNDIQVLCPPRTLTIALFRTAYKNVKLYF